MENKRFIAGAVCPQCNLADKIFTYGHAGNKWRACAACTFVECFAEPATSPDEELPTRVNQHRIGEQPLAHEIPSERVTLVDSTQPGTKPRTPDG